MKDKELSKLLITAAGAVALIFVVYQLVETVRDSEGLISDSEKKKSKFQKKGDLASILHELDDEGLNKASLLMVLRTLLEHSAFTHAQNLINELGYLPKIVQLLNHPDREVKQKTALLINNLSLNEGNQLVLRECIPQLVQILSSNTINISTIELSNAVLCALTNLTTLNESHDYLLNHMNVLYGILQGCDVVQIKLQVLKIFVNISTNKKICENKFEFDAQLLHSLEPYISSNVDDMFLLRSVCCCANVLESLHRRWRHGSEPTVTSPEFVSEKVQEELGKLSLHQNEDIRFHARRCVAALQDPVTPSLSSVNSLDELDILEVLKI